MIYYIGRFPPPYGGVTIKNNLLFMRLKKENIDVRVIDTNSLRLNNPFNVLFFIYILLNKDNIFIIGLAGKWRKYISYFLYIFNRKSLRKSLLIVMGGAFSKQVIKDDNYSRCVSEYKCIYVETQKMKNLLCNKGICSVEIFPNCRNMPESIIKPKMRKGMLKCVFFSMIYPEKGVDLILDCAKNLVNCEFDFWGDINESYKKDFLNTISKLSNCNYKGVFSSDKSSVYNLLNKYDIMLFPTRIKSEGVPGTLVEAKIAGLPAIVSDIAFNSEIIQNGIDGIVLDEYSVNNLKEKIIIIRDNDNLLSNMKKGALVSSKDYIIDNHIDLILNNINI